MRIALVILHADPARGGAERYTIDLAAALRGRGHQVAIVASKFDPAPRHADDVHLDTGSVTRVGHYLQFLDQLDRYLAGQRYDIIHAMLPVRSCDVYHPHAGIAMESAAGGSIKYEGPVMQIVSRVANRLNRRRQRFALVERALLTGPNPPVVLCLSEYLKRVIRKHYLLDDRHVAMLFNAVDLDRFDPSLRPEGGAQVRKRFAIDSSRTVALLMAQDFSRKGLREAISAMAQVRDPRLVLLVVGKQDPAPYRQIAEEKELADRVIFAGSTDDPQAFYRAADFFVLPTRHDPCSLVVLEALAMGLPVISTVQNGACEIMTDRSHGFVLKDPADNISLAAALRSMLDPELRRAMSAACLALRPRLAYGHHLDELIEIYKARLAAK